MRIAVGDLHRSVAPLQPMIIPSSAVSGRQNPKISMITPYTNVANVQRREPRPARVKNAPKMIQTIQTA